MFAQFLCWICYPPNQRSQSTPIFQLFPRGAYACSVSLSNTLCVTRRLQKALLFCAGHMVYGCAMKNMIRRNDRVGRLLERSRRYPSYPQLRIHGTCSVVGLVEKIEVDVNILSQPASYLDLGSSRESETDDRKFRLSGFQPDISFL